MTPPSRVRADLLRELREAAPMAVAPEPAVRRTQPAEPAADQPGTGFELRVTTQRWSPLRISGMPGGPGVRAALGPVRLSLRMPGR